MVAKEAAGEHQQLVNEKTKRTMPLVLARLVMMTSWGAALVLAWTTVVSPDIRWRFAAMSMSVLVLAPTLVLGFRQIGQESSVCALTRDDESGPETEDDESEEEQSGQYFDQPTGLASKRYLTVFLHREISRSARANANLSLAIFDVHDFAKLVENAGMTAALTGLADVGARLRSALRDYDLVARYAGGRLAVVLPETGERGASEVVERLHGLATSVCVNERQLSVTVGLVAYPEHGSTAEELINSAHRALNRGKFAAANRVHTLTELRKAS